MFTVSPEVERAKVKFRGGVLEIAVKRAGAKAIYPEEIKFNGVKLDRPWIAVKDLQRGGRLEFTLTDRPCQRTPVPDWF